MGKVFYGPRDEDRPICDLSSRETYLMAAMIAVIVWLGLFPQPVLNAVEPAVTAIKNQANKTHSARGGTQTTATSAQFQAQEILTIVKGHRNNR
jgi:NADH:ubiquinone oxidoreductase subunit 4 (subunit M)